MSRPIKYHEREEVRERARSNYLYLKSRGLCVRCRTRKAIHKKTMCGVCSYDCTAYQAARREIVKSKYEEYKRKGICVTCKEAKAVKGRIRCKSCSDRLKIYQKTRRV